MDFPLVTLATSRGLLVGEPGTAKSLLSELITTAVSGVPTLTIQGGAATTENHVPRPGRRVLSDQLAFQMVHGLAVFGVAGVAGRPRSDGANPGDLG